MIRRHQYGLGLFALGVVLAMVGPSSVAFAHTTTTIHSQHVTQSSVAHSPSAFVQTGTAGSASITPQFYTGGGGYAYPPSSPNYVYRNYAGSNGVDVPYRQGTSSWGLIHVINRHDTATSIVGATVSNGQWQLEQASNPGGA